MTTTDGRRPAILLVGPTGSGKTPLGERLEAHGLWGRRCVHFDFGERLRACARGGAAAHGLDEAACSLVRRVVDEGALLEDEQFPIARAILESFVRECGADGSTLVVLNGLPRHATQARAMDAVVCVEAVVRLACEARAAIARIRSNVAGDRVGRDDDGDALVRKKLATYAARTEPLVELYRARGVPVIELCIDERTTPEAAAAALEADARAPERRHP
jgi:adenylate kinase